MYNPKRLVDLSRKKDKVITNVKGLQVTIYGNLYEIISEDSVKGDSIKKYPPQNEPAHF